MVGEIVVIEEAFELCIELERSLPPAVEGDFASPYCKQPLRWLTLHRKREATGEQQLAGLEPEASAVHGVLRVEAELGDQLDASAASALVVPVAAPKAW